MIRYDPLRLDPTPFFSEEERRTLHSLASEFALEELHNRPRVLEERSIDYAYVSSKIEGCTYSKAGVSTLLKYGWTEGGKPLADALMLLDLNATFLYIMNNAKDLDVCTKSFIKDIHAMTTSHQLKADEKGIVLTDNSNLVFCNDDGSLRTYYGTKKIFNRFLSKYDLNNLGIHFHTLRHTYSNMLFEADRNPKVIQALLGHKSVKTTITTYNSVDKSYFQKATDVLNNNFKTNESKETEEMEDDELDAELERLLKEKQERRRRNSHDFEM